MINRNGVSLTNVLNEIKRRLGVPLHRIELSDEAIVEIMQRQSLTEFSKYFPFTETTTVGPADYMPEMQGRGGVYIINTDLEVQSVHEILISSSSFLATGTMVPNYADPFTAQIKRDYQSMTQNPFIFELHHPNRLHIYPKLHFPEQTLVYCNFTHSPYLRTIPINLRESFIELVYLDVLVTLESMRNRFSTLRTVYGEIEVLTDEMRSAKQDRKELLDTFRENMLYSARAKKIWYM